MWEFAIILAFGVGVSRDAGEIWTRLIGCIADDISDQMANASSWPHRN